MPRRARDLSPKRLTQKTLHSFVTSSSPASQKGASSSRLPATGRTGRRRARSPTSSEGEGSQSSDAGVIHFEPEIIELDDDEDASPRRPINRRSARHAIVGSQAKNPLVFDDNDEEAEDAEVPRKGKAGVKRRSAVMNFEEEEEEVKPKKRKLVRGVRPPSPEEDEYSLMNEVDEERKIVPLLHAANFILTSSRNH